MPQELNAITLQTYTAQGECASLLLVLTTHAPFLSGVSGHPRIMKAAVLDIITPDLESGPVAATAEMIAVANDCLNSFPNLVQDCDIRISHSKSKCTFTTSIA
jgi:hypothetical protein